MAVMFITAVLSLVSSLWSLVSGFRRY